MAKRKRTAPPPVDTPVAKKRAPNVPQEKTSQYQATRDRITELNAVNSPLLRLPAELRIAIYTYALKGNWTQFIISAGTGELMSLGTLRSCGHGLLLASRQLHTETALLPYQLGWFYFDLPGLTRKQWYPFVSEFLERRSKEQIKAMRCLIVSPWPVMLRSFTSGTGSYWVKRLARSKKQQRT